MLNGHSVPANAVKSGSGNTASSHINRELSMTRNRTNRLSAVALLASMAGANLAVPVLAEPLPSQRVVVSDLDLSTPLGQQRLERRIAAAIDQVCPKPERLAQRSVAALHNLAECRAAATGSVQQQLARLGVPAMQRQARLD
jgi:UrcA family protein